MKWTVLIAALAVCGFAGAQESTGVLAGTHACVILDGAPDLLRKDAGFVPVTTIDARGPDLAQLAAQFATGWGSEDAMEVAAMSIGIDVIHVIDGPEEETLEGKDGAAYRYAVASIDPEHGWVALQFTVESGAHTLPSAPAAVAAEGADATSAIFCYVLPGSSLETPDPVAEVTRSLSGAEMGVSTPVRAFNAHLAFYLLGPEVGTPMLSHALPEGDVTFYFTLKAAAGGLATGHIYQTTWDGDAESWGAVSTLCTAAELGLGAGVVIDGLAVDAVEAGAEKILFSTNDTSYASEVMFFRRGEASPWLYMVSVPPSAPDKKPQLRRLDELLGDIPLGDFCDRDPFSAAQQSGSKPTTLLDHYMLALRRPPGLARDRLLQASGMRTVTHGGAPAMATFCTRPAEARPKVLRLETWISRWNEGYGWEEVTSTRHTRLVSGIAGPAAWIRPFPPAMHPRVFRRNRRMVARWSFDHDGRSYVSHQIVLPF